MSASPKPPTEAKLTKSLIDGLQLAEAGKQYLVRDTDLKGFCIRVGSTSKTFIVYKRLPHGSPKRITLGRYGALTLDGARKLAQEKLSELVHGIDVNALRKIAKADIKRDERAATQTLQWIFDNYKAEHLVINKGNRAATLRSFGNTLDFFRGREVTLLKQGGDGVWFEECEVVLSDWLRRPFREIKPQEVLERHDLFARAKPAKLIGGVLRPMQRTHQIAFKFAQAAFNFMLPRIMEETGEDLRNPIDTLKTHKRWKPVKKRCRIIDFQQPGEIGAWIEAINRYRQMAPVPADFMMFSLLQAGRSIELWGLAWEQIDLKGRTVTYRDTKNGGDYVFPLSANAFEILNRRSNANPEGCKWVWAFASSKTGHIPEDAKWHFKRLKAYGAKYVSSHDLKRTWASAANDLNVNERYINYLLKHQQRDVNEHYFVRNKGVLADILQKVEDMFFEKHRQYLRGLKRKQVGLDGENCVELE